MGVRVSRLVFLRNIYQLHTIQRQLMTISQCTTIEHTLRTISVFLIASFTHHTETMLLVHQPGKKGTRD